MEPLLAKSVVVLLMLGGTGGLVFFIYELADKNIKELAKASFTFFGVIVFQISIFLTFVWAINVINSH